MVGKGGLPPLLFCQSMLTFAKQGGGKPPFPTTSIPLVLVLPLSLRAPPRLCQSMLTFAKQSGGKPPLPTTVAITRLVHPFRNFTGASIETCLR